MSRRALGPLLFNIYLSDLFLFFDNSHIVNYADDNSPFSCNADIDSVISKLTNDSKTLMEWFCNNCLNANPDKFHSILSKSDGDKLIKIEHTVIHNSNCEKLLGVKIDNKLSFEDHVIDLCTKASQKLHALSRIANFMNLQQRRKIMNAFENSQFGYCPLVWMLHSRKLNTRINRIHERALRVVCIIEYNKIQCFVKRIYLLH